MRIPDLSREAWRNLARAPVRSVGALLAVAVIFGSAVGSEFVVTSRIVEEHSEFTAAGGYVAVAVTASGVGIPARECAQMDDRSSEVVAAGYVVERGRIAIASAPGRDVRAIGVSGGTIGAMDDSYRSHRLAGEIAVSGALAVDLGLGSYSYLAIGSAGDIATTRRVAAVFNPEPRAPRYSSVVATLVPGASVASECWVEFRPHMYEAGASALGSALTVGDEPVIVRRIVDPGYDLRRARVDLSMRSERFAWVVGGLIAGGLLWLLAWTRRSEFALLSALGWRTSHTAVLIQLENCYVVLAGATVGTLWAVLLAETANGPLLADQIAIGGRTALSLGLLSILIGGLATTTTRGGKATLALLKQE